MSAPEIGVVFPMKQADLREDVLEFAPRMEAAGLDFISVYDHVVHVSRRRPDTYSAVGTNCEFDGLDNIHEPLVLLGAMAVTTTDIKLMTSCVVAPLRQTALLAKQASQVDRLSGGGRLILGLSIGWNETEFQAMDGSFAGRAERLEDQVAAIRSLTGGENPAEDVGAEHLTEVFIADSPSANVPIYLGGLSVGAIKRAARIADGWLPLGSFDDEMRAKIDLYRREAESAQPDLERPAIVGRVDPFESSLEDCVAEAEQWHAAGATHIAIGGSSSDLFHPQIKDSYYMVVERTRAALERSFANPRLFLPA
jgi:probable F420-dependent oxidoreductase